MMELLKKDKGLKQGLSRVTPPKIAEVMERVFEGETGARVKFYLESCMRCGMCFYGCHLCISHDLDPRYSPVGKVKDSLEVLYDKREKATKEDILRAAIIAFTECNLCKRCVMYCPLGIDTAYLMSVVRRICFLLGVVPEYIQDTVNSHSATYNQMWVKGDEWIDTLYWQEEELSEEMEGASIPVDKKGAEIMYSVIGPEPKFSPQLIYEAAAIFNAAGVDWTFPSSPGWDNSDMAMFVRDDVVATRIKRKHFETAMRLGVQRIVMGECGHGLRSVYDVVTRQLGWKFYPIPVVHAVEFYWELLSSGKIKIKKKLKRKVTIHDPCNISRGRGLHYLLRQVVHAVCENVVEMHPNMEHNYCCGAGGGVINCGPIYKEKRMKFMKVKADQLRATGAELVITPCHNCHSGLHDIISYYDLSMEVSFLTHLIYECMQPPQEQ